MSSENGSWYEPLREFAVHVFVGTAIFVVVATPAVILSLLISQLPQGVDPVVTNGLIAAKYLIFVVDLGLFAVHTIRSSIQAARAIWSRK